MKFDKHGNGVGLDDLYLLPETNNEMLLIVDYINQSGRTVERHRSDVKGHDWYGKMFFVIPFGESLKTDIKKFLETATTKERTS